ncbi:excinuclease ABC subunit C [Rossellomorea sp. SC111]|nr:excinuclease ABC subunit C [Rossellomorea sp. SC111]
MDSINDVKSMVNKLIEDHSGREITPNTNYNTSGIYMIYIDNFTSDKIVPIYIGQSKDVQKRYKVHLSEILSLNRLSYEDYYNYFFYKSDSFYEGRFKSSKIFKFMIENSCTLSDFRVVLLEEVETEELDKKELDYIQQLNASFFGFNQLNSFLAAIKLHHLKSAEINELDDFLRLVQKDIKGIYFYYDYGFTRFNLEHAFLKKLFFLSDLNIKIGDTMLFKEVNLEIKQLLTHYRLDFQIAEIQQLEDNWRWLSEPHEVAVGEYNKAFALLANQVKGKFKELQFYSKKAFENFLYSIVKEEKETLKGEFLKYLEKKNCSIDFYQLFDQQIAVVVERLEEKEQREKPVADAYNKFQERKAKFKRERYKMIFPSIHFSPFFLGDRMQLAPLNIEEGVNTIHIQLFISNNGRTRGYYPKDPFIVRFDYCYFGDSGRKVEKQYYIENETTLRGLSGIQYIEKDFDRMFVFNPERFSITGLIDDEIDNSFISVLAEYKHGINDYTLKDKKLVRLEGVLDELQQLVNDETEFVLTNTESKGCLEKSLFNEQLQGHSLAVKLLETGKRRKRSKKKTEKVPKSPKKIDKVKVDPKIRRAEAFRGKVLAKSNNKIDIVEYISSKEKVTAKCQDCGHTWKKRSDHLLARLYCLRCDKA